MLPRLVRGGAAALFVALLLIATSQSRAQQAVKLTSESDVKLQSGQAYTLKHRVGDQIVEKVVSVGPIKDWKIGVRGHAHSDGGYCVHETVVVPDYNVFPNKFRAPAKSFLVNTGSGNLIKWELEFGDRILSIDGYLIESETDLVVAINSSQNLPSLEIEFLDRATGNIYTGSISAAKTKK